MDIVYTNPGEPVAEVRIIGHVNTLESPVVLEKILPIAESVSALILDCSAMPYITSSGLRALMRIGKTMLAKQGRMSICNLDGLAKTIYLSTGFARVFPPADTIEEAREAVK